MLPTFGVPFLLAPRPKWLPAPGVPQSPATIDATRVLVGAALRLILQPPPEVHFSVVSPASEIATQPPEVHDPFEQESPQEVHESQLTELPSMIVAHPFLEPLSPFQVALLPRWSETSVVVTRQTQGPLPSTPLGGVTSTYQCPTPPLESVGYSIVDGTSREV